MKNTPTIKETSELYRQWDHEKNVGIDPAEIRRGSNKKVWWKCENGHSWKAVVSTRKKHGCPYCPGRFPVPGVNDLATVRPDILEEWDYEKNKGVFPQNCSSGSGKKVWWKCVAGHSYSQGISHHLRGGKCPYCHGKTVLPGFNDLYERMPGFLEEWDFPKNLPLTPRDLRPHSNKKVWWRCKRGHSWQDTVNHRAGGRGCPYCSGRKVLPGFNDLGTVRPDVAAQWDHSKNQGITPQDVTAGSNRKVWWRCKAGHSWEAVVYSRKTGICPYCSGKKLLPGFNDLQTVSPEIAAQWDHRKNGSLCPDQITAHSKEKIWWRCEKGHSWRIAVGDRVDSGCGCPFCWGRYPVPGENDLKTQHPELMELWDKEKNKILPEQIMSGSGKKAWWRCKRGHSWQAGVGKVVKGDGCPYCAGKKILVGFNDLKSVRPELAEEWDYEKNSGLLPEQVTQGSGKRVWWKCRAGHSWRVSVYDRTLGNGCPYCSGLFPIRGETDLQTLNPELAEQWDYEKNGELFPCEVALHSNKKVWWRCGLGHGWKATAANRSQGQGCPYCKGKKAVEGETDLASIRPELIEEWDFDKNIGIQPNQFTSYSGHMVWWKCKEGHSWKAKVYSRNYGAGCPYCTGRIQIRTHFIT